MAAASARPPAPVHVVAGALIDARGAVLIAERPAGKAYAGRWELPGGKRLPGETRRAALARELREELGLDIGRATPLIAVIHRYPGATAPVLIDAWRVASWRGEPAGLDGQRLRWCARDALATVDFLEADRPIVSALRLPRAFVRVDGVGTLAALAAAGRARTAWLVAAPAADPVLLRRLVARGDGVFLIDPARPPTDGFGAVYTRARDFERRRDGSALVGCVVHSAAQATEAAVRGAELLLVRAPQLAAAERTAIAAAGRPCYLDRATPRRAGGPPATGRLRW